ncbi:MAG: hypothetical protein ABEI96_06520 [Haloarculaceae archaeon]
MSKERESTDETGRLLESLGDDARRVVDGLERDLRLLGGKCETVAHRIVDPLRKDDELEHFTLAIPDAQTTTIEGDVGWASRPPAVVACPNCDGEVLHAHWRDDVDCPRCLFELPYDQFPKLDVLYLSCPICHTEMNHGYRHPNAIDVPEWATCPQCQYHWEFDHDLQLV